jgi:hypothetical protein
MFWDSKHTGPGIALKIELEADDKVEPIGGQVQNLTGRQDDFIGHRVDELRVGGYIRIGPIDNAVAGAEKDDLLDIVPTCRTDWDGSR